MITLCPTSYEIAQKMPNFSAWVRTKVLEANEAGVGTKHVLPKMPKNYMCKHCLAIESHWSIECPTLEVSE